MFERIKSILSRLGTLEERIIKLKQDTDKLLVLDYIVSIESNHIKQELIPKYNAIKFRVPLIGYNRIISYIGDSPKIDKEVYTTRENYDNHKPMIDKWEREILNEENRIKNK